MVIIIIEKKIVSFVCYWFILVGYRKCWLLYLFYLIWNTQKITWTITKARCFLILKMFGVLMHWLIAFYWPITWEMYQNKIGIKLIPKFWSNGVTPCQSFFILVSFFMPHVGPKWNIYLSLCLAKLENKI